MSIPIGETPEALRQIEYWFQTALSWALMTYLIANLLLAIRRGRRG